MKIYNWIDSLFNSKKKRRNILAFFVSFYWLIQLGFLGMLFFSLARLDNYESLFVFLPFLERYDGCVFIRIFVKLLSTTVSWQSFLTILKQIHMADLFALIGTFLVLNSSKHKKKTAAAELLFALLLIILGLLLFFGLSAKSLQKVILILKIGSSIMLVIVLILFILVLLEFYKSLSFVIKEIFRYHELSQTKSRDLE